jgi:conjugal transfer pilus assembly protein TraE
VRLAEFSRELAVRSGFGRTLQALLVVFMGLTVLLSVAVAFRSNNIRTVIVPPAVTKGFWVDDAAVSPEYLEQMAFFLAQLVYNVTPANADFNARTLLNYAAPSSMARCDSRPRQPRSASARTTRRRSSACAP